MKKFIKRDNYLIFGSPQINQEDINEVLDSLESGWIGTGPKVAQFENQFQEYIGSNHTVALNSCTAALHLSMLVAGLQPGDEVITTPMTFAATVNTVIHSGATPVLVDCDRETMLVDPNLIEEAITPRTRAVIPVHLHGRPCEMDAIMDIAHRHDLIVIEDAAHAIETVYKGKKIGTIGDLTCFSFYVTKNVITGEGGMVTTNNSDYARKIKIYGLHGMSHDAWKRFSDDGYKHYQVVVPGYKYNMMDLQASLGLHQLQRVEKNLERREAIWNAYDQAFADLPIGLPAPVTKDYVHARHLYTILVDDAECGKTRDEFMRALHELNIGTGVHYIGVHLHEYYRHRFGYTADDFPNASWISERTLSLPLSPKMTDYDVESVIDAVRFLALGGHA